MKVKYTGFKLFSQSVKFDSESFWQHLEDNSGYEEEGISSTRHYFFDNNSRDGYLVGLVVTLKDQKKSCRIDGQSDDFRFKTEDLLKDEKLVDFNFFSLKKATKKGIYQYYHNSCSASLFGDVCKRIFKVAKKRLIQEKAKELSSDSIFIDGSKEHKKAIKIFNGRAKFAVLYDPRNAGAILSSLGSIKEMEIAFEAPSAPVDAAIATNNLAKTVSFSYKFEMQRQVNDIIDLMNSLIGRNGFKRGKVKGANDMDEERTIDLLKCPYDFGQEDFDQVVQKVNNLKVLDFAYNPIVDLLIDKLESEEYAHVFAEVEEGE